MVYEMPEQLIAESADNCRKIWNRKEELSIDNLVIFCRVHVYQKKYIIKIGNISYRVGYLFDTFL